MAITASILQRWSAPFEKALTKASRQVVALNDREQIKLVNKDRGQLNLLQSFAGCLFHITWY